MKRPRLGVLRRVAGRSWSPPSAQSVRSTSSGAARGNTKGHSFACLTASGHYGGHGWLLHSLPSNLTGGFDPALRFVCTDGGQRNDWALDVALAATVRQMPEPSTTLP